MAQDSTAAPTQGSPTNAQLATDNRRLERETRGKAAPNGLWKLGIALVLCLVLAIVGLAAIVNRDRDTDTTADRSPIVVGNVEPDVDNEPLWPDGVTSWLQWEAVATPKMREALLSVAGVTPEQTQRWAAEEQALGKSFQAELEPGTAITNSGSNESGWYEVGYTVKPGDTLFLVTDKGVIAVKQSCGNPVRPADGGQEVKGTNPYPNFIGEHRASVPVPPPTPGYPGRAEEVTEEQQAAPIGGLDPTPVGTPGTGSGGFTPPGVTEQPDGSVVYAPPPVGLPAPPPPLNEVPAGAVVAVPD